MPQRPRAVTIISWLFIVVGAVSVVGGFLGAHGNSGASRAVADHPAWETALIQIFRSLAIVAGWFMLRGRNWARWLLILWVGYHVVIGLKNSLFSTVVHTLLFGVIAYFLFRKTSSNYFHGAPPDQL